jgi:gluconate 5-dehydrogenase
LKNSSHKEENLCNNPFSLEGKTAVITGGATGLGLAMTESMIQAGAKVIVLGRREKKQAEETLSRFLGKAVYYTCDVTDTEAIPALAEQILREQGPVHILCNNAGNHCKKPIEDMSCEEFSEVLKVHLVGAFALSKAFMPHMKRQGEGSILFIASMTSFIGQPYVVGYSAAKAGYLGMVHTLAAEGGSFGVRVNAIAPGWIDTPMFRKATENDVERKTKILGRTPMGKVGEPSDIGWAAVYLCSEAAKFITGICLPVDGGALIGF